jgi:hypothetical protein
MMTTESENSVGDTIGIVVNEGVNEFAQYCVSVETRTATSSIWKKNIRLQHIHLRCTCRDFVGVSDEVVQQCQASNNDTRNNCC